MELRQHGCGDQADYKSAPSPKRKGIFLRGRPQRKPMNDHVPVFWSCFYLAVHLSAYKFRSQFIPRSETVIHP